MKPPTLLLPSRFYHIFNHANGSENLFRTRENYYFFLKRYAVYIEPVADTFAYCLMPNHFHFSIRVKTIDEIEKSFLIKKKIQPHLPQTETGQFEEYASSEKLTEEQAIRFVSKSFANLFSSYAQAYNKHFERHGNLFITNFKRVEIISEDYFTRLIYYIHRNPTHHGFCKDWRDWEHSSYHSLLSNKPTALKRQETLAWFGGEKPFQDFHLQYFSAQSLESISLEL